MKRPVLEKISRRGEIILRLKGFSASVGVNILRIESQGRAR
ncbi:hypothetical protein CFII64_27809 [Pseudomonas sp. CFII64]|jgi:hypothetical protein|nr:hypothetical protein CFII64_27809 [Pseudomonas sp. CFII64]